MANIFPSAKEVVRLGELLECENTFSVWGEIVGEKKEQESIFYLYFGILRVVCEPSKSRDIAQDCPELWRTPGEIQIFAFVQGARETEVPRLIAKEKWAQGASDQAEAPAPRSTWDTGRMPGPILDEPAAPFRR